MFVIGCIIWYLLGFACGLLVGCVVVGGFVGCLAFV